MTPLIKKASPKIGKALVRTRGFEPPHNLMHHPLKMACLPVSPRARIGSAREETKFFSRGKTLLLCVLKYLKIEICKKD